MYHPQPINDDISPEILLLQAKLAAERVTLMIGAGVSKAAPTDLPLASEVATHLSQHFGQLFPNALSGVEETDLLEVANAIASFDENGLRLMQEEIASDGMGMDSRPPNHAHRVLAVRSQRARSATSRADVYFGSTIHTSYAGARRRRAEKVLRASTDRLNLNRVIPAEED